MRHPLIIQVKKTIRKYRMLKPGDKVVIGLSGGADSMALLQALGEIRDGLQISLLAAHLDHGLRPGGEAETRFAGDAAAKLGVPFFGKRADVRTLRREKRLNLQEAAREARYAFLAEVARTQGAAKIALGHTADDQAESVVMRILRGSGTRGLSGIPPVREGWIIRPLIESWRNEVESFLKQKGVSFLQDPSNASDQYLRNRIRHEILPLLRNANSGIDENLVRIADLFRAEEDFWRGHLKEIFPRFVKKEGRGFIALDISSLARQPLPVRLRAYRMAIEKVRGDLRRIYMAHVLAVEEIAKSKKPNRVIRLPRGISVTRSYQELAFSSFRGETKPYEYTIAGPGRLEIPEIGRALRLDMESGRGVVRQPSPAIAFLHFDDLEFPLTVRPFRPGDRFQPLGMRGEKKIKDLFIDCKIPAAERRRIPLLCRGERILWVAGLRIDQRARLREETKKVLRAELVE